MQKQELTYETELQKLLGKCEYTIFNNKAAALVHRALVAARRDVSREDLGLHMMLASEASRIAIDAINRIASSSIKPPEVRMDLRSLKRDGALGYMREDSPKILYIDPNQSINEIFETSVHETVHYASWLLSGKPHKASAFIPLCLSDAAVEGTADFVSLFIALDRNSRSPGTIIRVLDDSYGSLRASLDLYCTIASDLSSASTAARPSESMLYSYFANNPDAYSNGAAITTILLISNDLDCEKTAKELLTTNAASIASRVIDIVSEDKSHTLKSLLEKLVEQRSMLIRRSNRDFSEYVDSPLRSKAQMHKQMQA